MLNTQSIKSPPVFTLFKKTTSPYTLHDVHLPQGCLFYISFPYKLPSLLMSLKTPPILKVNSEQYIFYILYKRYISLIYLFLVFGELFHSSNKGVPIFCVNTINYYFLNLQPLLDSHLLP